jgi:hypothetical protein
MRLMIAVVVLLVGAGRMPAAESSPARGPFSPSPLMRAMVQKPTGSEAAGTPDPATAAPPMPTLEGMVVIEKSVLACFRAGTSFILVECGERFQVDGRAYVFTRYDDEAVTLQDPEGKAHVVRIEPPQAPAGVAARDIQPD